MFEWLFNYPANLWQEASFAFTRTWHWAWLLLCAFVVFLAIIASVWRQPLSKARRAMLVGLQTFVGAVLLFMLWQPALLLEVAEAGENTVVWVLDASTSMQTEDASNSDANALSRFDAAVGVIEGFDTNQTVPFRTDVYAQTDNLQKINNTDLLSTVELSNSTDIGQALDDVLGAVNQSAVAAVVLLSDGSDNATTIDAKWWQRLSSAGVPVHTIGVGQLSHPSDVQLSHVALAPSAAAEVLMTSVLTVSHGSAGSARLRVFSGQDLIAAEDIVLPEGVQQSEHEVLVPTGEPGVRALRFEVVPDGEVKDPDLKNNTVQRVVSVGASPRKILYVEGEPRWEYKFLRRALNGNPSIDVVSLLRTSANKFYRQGVRDANDLAQGFPLKREELFEYDAIIIGSLEAAELSTTQQLALRDFVAIRGGSLLMLAGRHGLADGGWGRSVVAAALPSILDARLSAKTFERQRVMVTPTVAGYRTDWLQLDQTPQANQLAWQGLPLVADVQSLGPLKPGAIVLLEHSGVNVSDEPQPLLVSQRYGKGQSMLMGTSGSWRWQMGLDSSDQRHEKFWTQLATQLIADVVPRVSVSSGTAVYRDVDTASISVVAYAPDYTPLQTSVFNAQLTLPDGTTKSIQLGRDIQQPGHYTADVDMPMDGPYLISAQAPLNGEAPVALPFVAEHWWVRESGTAESFNNTQQQQFLQRVADVSGGSYLPFSESDSLIDVLSVENAALKREMSLPIWNLPILFIALLLAKASEWLLRLRWKRL